MTLHIFNPDHDLALAFGGVNFTAPHAARCLRNDLAFLPALWCERGDAVLVENAVCAEKSLLKLQTRLRRRGLRGEDREVRFVEWSDLKLLQADHDIVQIAPWGWNMSLRDKLQKKLGAECTLLPPVEAIDDVRRLSHRRLSAELLSGIATSGAIGEAFECHSLDEVRERVDRLGRAVLKAPWSSSGRGLRFIDAELDVHRTGWVRNLLSSQGSVMVEPFYNKVKDFAMEFSAQEDGTVCYNGLSLFSTRNGAYVGNVLATEEAKLEIISKYISVDLLEKIKEKIIECITLLLEGKYVGPFGIDMMVVAMPDANGFALHPCVEINLRRTMGHVALALSPIDNDIKGVMRIGYNKNNYQLCVEGF